MPDMRNLDLFAPQPTAANDDGEISYDQGLSQWMTPSWAAEAIVEHALPKFEEGAVIVEPSAGIGRFLDALPKRYRNIGVEIDPKLASIARAKGHEVVIGDFRNVELPIDRADAIIGNPPFELAIFNDFLSRSHSLLDDGGQVIMLLPTYIFQTAHNVVRWNRSWSLAQEMVPRSLFGRLKLSLMLARFTRDPAPTMSGLILYQETAAISDMPRVYQRALQEGRSGWAAVVEQALHNLGGRSHLKAIYAEVEPRRPTPNRFWREKIRQTLQLTCERAADGSWALPSYSAAI